MKAIPTTALAVLAAALVVPAFAASRGTASSAGTFHGWTGSIQLQSRDTPAQAVVVPGVGGRVLSYGLRGENVLWVNPDAAGKTYTAGGPEFEPGGFYCDLGPESALFPAHPALTIGPWDHSVRKSFLVELRAPEDKAIGVELEREIMFDPRSGDLGFVHRLENRRERDAAHTFWHRIACRPGGWVIVPVNPKSRFPSGWAVCRTDGGRGAYDGTKPEVPGVRILDGVLVAKTGSGAAKIGLDSDAQWVAYALDRTLFVVHFPVYSTATYSDGGNSVTVDWDERRTELQPLGAEARVRSRKKTDFPIKWSLIELATPVSTPEAARALVPKIPGSPFQ